MTTDRNIQDTYGRDGQTSDTSRNLGRQQAESGSPFSPQQPGESYTSVQTRQNEYDWTKSQQDKKGG
jgi:hypothetical protein